MKKEIHEVLVVEGKTDTQKLQKIFGPNVKTVETNGLQLNKNTFAILNELNRSCGLIIFTDPDFAGQKIRQQIMKILQSPVKQAFLPLTSFSKTKTKRGVAEASEAAIKQALAEIMTFDNEKEKSLSWTEYLELNLANPQMRRALIQKLNWPLNLNNKTFHKWLNWTGQNKEMLKTLMEE